MEKQCYIQVLYTSQICNCPKKNVEDLYEKTATSEKNTTENRREPTSQAEINLGHCERLMQEYNPPNEL